LRRKKADYVVRLDQPYGRHAKNLLEPREFPRDAEHRPYDDVSWALGYLYRVDVESIDDATILDMEDLRLLTGTVAFPGEVGEGDPEAYAVRHDGGNGMITARYLLDRFEVRAAKEPFEVEGEFFPAGSWIVPHRRGLRGNLTQIARDTMVDFVALDEMPAVETHELDTPKLALYHNWISTQPDGWVRMTFDRAGVPYDYIGDYTIRDGGLARKYDVILMAHQGRADAKDMVLGRDPKFGPLDYRPTGEFPSHGRIDSARDITGGLGYEGVAELEEFLNDGGTLVLLGSAGRLATDFGLVRNVSVTGGVNTPGSVIQTEVVRRDHPIAYGYDDLNYVFRTNGPLYSVPEKFDHWIVVKYGTKPLREDEANGENKAATEEKSEEERETEDAEEETDEPESRVPDKFMLAGYVDGRETLEKSGAILDVPRHAGGRVVLYSFNPMHRYLNHGDFNYVFNAILNWNDFPDPEPKDHPGLAKD